MKDNPLEHVVYENTFSFGYVEKDAFICLIQRPRQITQFLHDCRGLTFQTPENVYLTNGPPKPIRTISLGNISGEIVDY